MPSSRVVFELLRSWPRIAGSAVERVLFIPLFCLPAIPYLFLILYFVNFIFFEDFPYRVVQKGEQFFAVYDYELFAMLYPDEENRPSVIILPEERI